MEWHYPAVSRKTSGVCLRACGLLFQGASRSARNRLGTMRHARRRRRARDPKREAIPPPRRPQLQVQAEAELALRRDRAVAAIGGHGLHLGSLACPARHAYTPVLVRLLRN